MIDDNNVLPSDLQGIMFLYRLLSLTLLLFFRCIYNLFTRYSQFSLFVLQGSLLSPSNTLSQTLSTRLSYIRVGFPDFFTNLVLFYDPCTPKTLWSDDSLPHIDLIPRWVMCRSGHVPVGPGSPTKFDRGPATRRHRRAEIRLDYVQVTLT